MGSLRAVQKEEVASSVVTSSGNGKLEALRKRETALKAVIAAEQIRQQRAKAKLQAREFAAVGEVLCRYAGQSPEFKTMLRQVLPVAITAVADEKVRQFLVCRGWL
jgi:hypothetical protein